MTVYKWQDIRDKHGEYMMWEKLRDTFDNVYVTASLLRHIRNLVEETSYKYQRDVQTNNVEKYIDVSTLVGVIRFSVVQSVMKVTYVEFFEEIASHIKSDYESFLLEMKRRAESGYF